MNFIWEHPILNETPLARGVSFTTSIPHDLLKGISCPIACLINESGEYDDSDSHLYVGVIESKRVSTTLEHTIRIHTFQIPIETDRDRIHQSLPTKLRAHFTRSVSDLEPHKGLVKLPPETSKSVWEHITTIPGAERATAFIDSKLQPRRRRYSEGGKLQTSSILDAKSIFDWGPSRQKSELTRLSWLGDGESELRIYEDLAITLDAAEVADLEPVVSSQTGVAVFQKGSEELTVITANKLPLERVFGVDLIYINEVAESVVLVQYKMLEKQTRKKGGIAWKYRPDDQLRVELSRMDSLKNSMRKDPRSFRISDEMHFLKFIKRSSAERAQAGITISKEHFDNICPDRKKTIQFTNELGGNYLRHDTFCGLVRSGYVGSRPTTSRRIINHIDSILKHGHAVVVATQRQIAKES